MNACLRTPSRKRKVVAGVHMTANSVAALRRAVREAAARDAELEIVYIVADGPAGSESVSTQVREFIHDNVPAVDDVVASLRIESGDPAQVLVARSADAELLVIGACSNSERRGIYSGRVVSYCRTMAVCPVAICADHGASRNAAAAATGPPRVLTAVS